MFTISPTTIISPINSFFVKATEAFAELEMSGAVEAFSFDFEALNTKSLALVIKGCTSFEHSIDKYDTEMSSLLNTCIGKTYSANKKTMTLLSSDINKYKATLRTLDKQRKEKGLTPAVYKSLDQQYQECSDRLTQAYDRLADLKRYVMMPPATVDALKQTTTLSTQGFMLLEAFYKEYENAKDIFFDPKHLKHNDDEDDYRNALRALVEKIERHGALRKQLDMLEGRITTICRSKIYGKVIDPAAPESTARYELSLMNNASIRYKGYREMTKKIRKRTIELHKMLNDIKDGKPTPIGYDTVFSELMVMMVFMPLYGQMMSLYLEPKISVIESIK